MMKSLPDFKLLGYYECIDVPPGCTGPQLQKAWAKICETYHPEKGGDAETFRYLVYVHNVLQTKKLRNAYDARGKEAVEPHQPEMPAEVVIPDGAYRIVRVKINSASARDALELVACRQTFLPGGLVSYAEVISHFLRAASVDHNVKVLLAGGVSGLFALENEEHREAIKNKEFANFGGVFDFLVGLSPWQLPLPLFFLLTGTWTRFVEAATAARPDLDWAVRSSFKGKHVKNAHDGITKRLLDGDPLTVHTDFAPLVASLKGKTMICAEDELHWFEGGLWRVDDPQALHHRVEKILQEQLFPYRRAFFHERRLHVVTQDSWPDSLKNVSVISSIEKEVRSMFFGKPHVYDAQRNIIAFKNGYVYNFASGAVSFGTPNMKCLRHLPFNYTEWSPDLMEKYQPLIEEIVAFWRGSNTHLQQVFDSDGAPVPGNYAEDLAERLVAFADKVKALKVLLDLCADADQSYNVDKTLYFMQHLCRALASCDRFCEMLYIAGPPKTGKDVIATMLQELFGDLSTSGWACGTVPKDHFCCTGGMRQAKGSNTSIEASMAPSRITIIPEVPDQTLDMDNLKVLNFSMPPGHRALVKIARFRLALN